MNLYEINKQIEEVLNNMFLTADEETGEVSEDALKQLEELKTAREEKLDNIGAFIKNLEAEVFAIKMESETLKKRMDVKNRQIERLKNYVSSDLLSNNQKKFESARVVYSFRKSVAVKITDIDSLPRQYLKMSVSYKPDLTEMKRILSEGERIDGAILEERQNLQIK